MTNIGRRPTVDGPEAPLTVETHIIGLDTDLYDSTLTLNFISRLRSEQRFDSVDALAHQLEADKKATLSIVQDAIYQP